MKRLLGLLNPRQWTLRAMPWVGGLFVAAIVGLAAYDVVRGHREAVSITGRELDAHARVIAEQTARSLQAMDLVLRNLAEQSRRGTLAALDDRELHAYLQAQAVGLVQSAGLAVIHPNGVVRAVSSTALLPEPPPSAADAALFQVHRGNCCDIGLYVGGAVQSVFDREWAFPLSRRLESPTGEFAGVVNARGRVDYFAEFYRNVRLDEGTKITLVHQDGTLIARHPVVAAALGQRFALFDQMLAAGAAAGTSTGTGTAAADTPLRAVSPIDGVERFGALQIVPDYPLAVIVTRDVAVALAPWRAQAFGTAVRTLALSIFAVALLAVAMRQFGKLRAARASLEESQERFTLAVAGSDDGIWDWNLRTRVGFGSARARELMGQPPGPELQSTDAWFAAVEANLHPDDVVRRREAIDAHMSGRTPTYAGEFRIRGAGGGWRWVGVRGLCIRDAAGTPYRMAGSVTDIDARKRAEESLRQSEQRYELVVDGAHQGLWDWDVPTRMQFLSPRAQELLGLPAGEPLRPRGEWTRLIVIHPEDLDAVRAATSAYLRGTSSGHFEIEHRIRHGACGSWRWYRQRGVALRDAEGRPYRVAGSMEDITEQRQAQAERARLEQQLQQAKRLEAIGTLAGGIAHDFNNILGAILGYGELAQSQAGAGTPLRRHIDAVVSAGARARSLVQRILAFSRSGVGERMAVHVESVVDEAVQLLATGLPPDVQLERRLTGGEARVMGDPTQIHQVVMNLGTNAVQAMSASGTLTVSLDVVERAERIVATSVLPAGRYVRLRVRDTGSGIAADAIERIFDPFFTTKGVGVGTGLGLSLAHGIVTDLGGGIEVESRLGEGTTFTVYLPWHSAGPAGAGAAEADDPVPEGGGETILFVDDEEALVRLGEDVLAGLAYEPVGFTSSAEALAAFKAAPARFDAVLSDQAMPELSGVDLAREIHAIRPDIPIVLMTGFVSPALLERANAAGVVDVVAKPLVARDIARCLAGALG